MSDEGSGGDDAASCENVLRIRGLPWQATREEIAAFFVDCNIRGGVEGVQMTLSREGRPSGEAYIEMETAEDFTKGLEFHKKNMGSRYIEVFPSKKQEMEWMTQRSGAAPSASDHQGDNFVRLRGLPFGSTDEDIQKFFQGLEIARDGLVLPTDSGGRATGEAYVQFAKASDAEAAMGKHKEKIGHRYIEVFKSSAQEFRAVWNFAFGEPFPPGHRDFGNGSGHRGHHGGGGRGGYHDGPQNWRAGGPPHHGGHDQFPPKMRYNANMNNTRPGPYDRYPPRGGGHFMGGNGAGYPRGPPPGASRRPPGGWNDFDGPPRGGGRPPFGGGGGHRGGGFGGGPGHGRGGYDGPPSPGYGPGRHVIHMRGLPYKATEYDVIEFFRPLQPVDVSLLFDESGRSSGKADVEFSTHDDAQKAMNKDKANMQHRYIELFIHSEPSGGPQNAAIPPPIHQGAYGHPQDMGPRGYGHPGPAPVDSGVGSALAGLSLMGGLFNNPNSQMGGAGHHGGHPGGPDMRRPKMEPFY